MASSTSIILGTISNGLWLFVLIPQLYTNYQLKRTDSISMSLIISWIYGDILVIISGYLKHSNQMVIFGSVFHIMLILLLGSQVLYYRNLNKKGENTNLDVSEQRYIASVIGSLILFFPFIKAFPDVMADVLGWFALSLFVMSRIPQIILNYTRKSTEGLSVTSFVLINVSNYISLASILVDVHTYSQFLENIQWIVGPFFTTILDIIMLNASGYAHIENDVDTENDVENLFKV